MSKFARQATIRPPDAAVNTTDRTFTHEGGLGFARDAKSDLFLLAVTNMVREDTFYETGKTRDGRFVELIGKVTAEAPEWMQAFVPWLRDTANMRTASLVAAAEYAAVAPGGTHGRQVVASALQRADEPAELLAYWYATHGRRVPQPVKRGVADAVRRLYTERAALRYDGTSSDWRMGDVIEVVHPRPATAQQAALFQYLIDKRHKRDDPRGVEHLPAIRADEFLRAAPPDVRRDLIDGASWRDAGWSWERLSGWLPGGMDRAAWEAVIPQMGYMACLAGDTPIWLPDGTTAPIAQVVERRLPVLAPDRPFDTTSVRYGPMQVPRDRTMGTVVPTLPTGWHSMGVRPVVKIEFVSGRSIEATTDHRWVKRRRNDRRESWEWVTTADLRVGDAVPAVVGVDVWGDAGDSFEGYFVGAMLGDGCMTNHGTPEFAQADEPSRADMLAFLDEFAAKHGCVMSSAGARKWRFTFPSVRKMNPLTDLLRSYDVWGLRSGEKQFPNRPLSREFWIGALAGLIDTDGHMRLRRNQKGTLHASIEYATVSETMARQVADALLRLGVQSVMTSQPLRNPVTRELTANRIYLLSINRAASVKRAAELLPLRHRTKRERLAEAASALPETPMENVEQDRITAIGEPFDTEVFCVSIDEAESFVANGLVTGNCLRNLRNFDEADVSDEVATWVVAKLTDPVEVARSRQFPFRFYSAFREIPSLRWAYGLERALDLSLSNVPRLPGRTLVLVDCSASMQHRVSGRSKRTRSELAGLFGVAVAKRCDDARLVRYGSVGEDVTETIRWPLLRAAEAVGRADLGATWTFQALNAAWQGHERVVIVTDEQAHDAGTAVPSGVRWLYTFNLAGYSPAHATSGSGGRYTFGGLNDAAFRLIPLLECAQDADWSAVFASA